MRIIYNNILPVKGFAAINLFGVLFVRNGVALTERMLNHERIHTAQMKELGYVFFYILYVLEWLYRLTQPYNAYRNISFEREAYDNEHNLSYLAGRKHYAMWKR